jgi:hypothetical protein
MIGEAEELLHRMLESADVVGQDAGQTIIQVAVDRATLERLMAFGADAAEREDGGDDEPYEVPPVHACWFEAAPIARKLRAPVLYRAARCDS